MVICLKELKIIHQKGRNYRKPGTPNGYFQTTDVLSCESGSRFALSVMFLENMHGLIIEEN